MVCVVMEMDVLFSCTSPLPPTSVLVLSAPHFLPSASNRGSKLRVDLELVCYKMVLFDVIDLVVLVFDFLGPLRVVCQILTKAGLEDFMANRIDIDRYSQMMPAIEGEDSYFSCEVSSSYLKALGKEPKTSRFSYLINIISPVLSWIVPFSYLASPRFSSTTILHPHCT